MIGIVLVSHGSLATGLREAAEMITGPQEQLATVGMGAAADLDELRRLVEDAAAGVAREEGVLVLADLMGGSPANASAYLAIAGTQVVCGVNLSMLLEVLMNRDTMDSTELAQLALQSGKDGIINLTEGLAAAQQNP